MTAGDIGFKFIWEIKNFNLYSCKHLKSPPFKIEMLENSEWELLLQSFINGKVVVNIHRLKNNRGPYQVAVILKLSILKGNRSDLFTTNSSNSFTEDYRLAHPLSTNVNKIFSSEEFLNTLVVQCQLWNLTTKSYVQCSAVTTISVQEYYAIFPVYHHHGIIFLPAGQVDLKSVSEAYPDFKICWKNPEDVECNIHMAYFNSEVYARCEISIRDLNKTKKLLFKGGHGFPCEVPVDYITSSDYGYGVDVWKLEHIFGSVISDLKTAGDSPYIIDIKLTAATDSSENSCIRNISYDWTKIESNEAIQATSDSLLRKQLGKLRMEETLQDFTIQSNERLFKIHKTVFAAVSPVFRAMFELNMGDSIVSIENIDSETLETLISYVYAEKVTDLDWNDVLKLYTAADKYQILDLKEKCTGILTSKLSIQNLFDILEFADFHQDEILLISAKQLINENAKQLFRSEEWNNFKQNNLKIACEIMHGMCLRFTESLC